MNNSGELASEGSVLLGSLLVGAWVFGCGLGYAVWILFTRLGIGVGSLFVTVIALFLTLALIVYEEYIVDE